MYLKTIILFLSLFFMGCNKDVLVVATSANFAPFEYMDGNNFKGIDIEIAEHMAKEMGKRLVIKNMEFDSVIQSVVSGNVDIAISGLTINPTRIKVVDFSDSYFVSSQVVIVNDDDDRFKDVNTKDKLDSVINSINDLRIGVQTGTTGEFYVKGDNDWNFPGYKNAKILSFSNISMAASAMTNDQVDILVIDEMPAKVLVKTYNGISSLAIPLTQEKYAISVRKDRKDLLDKVNFILSRMKADGSIEMIINKYYDL